MNTHLVQTLLLATSLLGMPAWAQVFTQEEARVQEARVQRAYDDVNVGDSKGRVLEVAGKPTTTTTATDTGDEQWIYFSGHRTDVTLTFSNGRVTDKVQRFINIKEPKVAEAPRF